MAAGATAVAAAAGGCACGGEGNGADVRRPNRRRRSQPRQPQPHQRWQHRSCHGVALLPADALQIRRTRRYMCRSPLPSARETATAALAQGWNGRMMEAGRGRICHEGVIKGGLSSLCGWSRQASSGDPDPHGRAMLGYK
eukprot:365126-Chlamydomonas_euryale.AAC.10